MQKLTVFSDTLLDVVGNWNKFGEQFWQFTVWIVPPLLSTFRNGTVCDRAAGGLQFNRSKYPKLQVAWAPRLFCVRALPLAVLPNFLWKLQKGTAKKMFYIFLNVPVRTGCSTPSIVLRFGGWIWKLSWGWVVFVLLWYQITSLLTGQEAMKEKDAPLRRITVLSDRHKERPRRLQEVQPQGLTYRPAQAPTTWRGLQSVDTVQLSQGERKSQRLGQRHVQFLLLQPKCTADVSFYVSKAFLSSIRADLTEPRSSFKDFSLSRLTVASLECRGGEWVFPYDLRVSAPSGANPNHLSPSSHTFPYLGF